MEPRPPVRSFRADRVPASGVSARLRAFATVDAIPLDFELGCGAGVFSIRYARENPGRRLIAVEKTRQKFEAFAGRLRNHDELPNLLPLHANAVSIVTHDLAPASLDRLFIWYPNPFPEKARFVRLPFFGVLVDRLKRGGELRVATNVETQAEDYRRGACELWSLAPRAERVIMRTTEPEFRPRTLFEKKYFLRGEPLFDLSFEKL